MTDSLTASPHARFAMFSSSGCEEAAISRLTRGLAAGDEAAFREFHGWYFQRLFRYLLVAAHGDETLARDALQETFVRVARHARRFDDEKAFWDWLAVLGRSAVADGGRKQSRYRRLLAIFRYEPRPVESCVSRVDEPMFGALEAAMTQLDAADCTLLGRKYGEGCTTRQIAAEAGVTEGAVESRLVRIRRELRGHILRVLRHDD